MEWIYLVLAAVVIAFGIGVLVWNRRRAARRSEVSPAPAPGRLERPPQPAPGTLAEPVAEAPPAPPEVAEPPTLRGRLGKARAALAGVFAGVLGRHAITDETWDDLEEALLRADVGIGTTTRLLDSVRTTAKDNDVAEPSELRDALRAEMKGRLAGTDRVLRYDGDARPNVWLFVGVNGVGKTTSIGKVANQQVGAGRSVILTAGDTYRAAAVEQLTTWAERAGVDLVRWNEGGDPRAAVFDAIERAASRDVDLVLADTAGRLHTRTNLMEELRKVRRVAEKGAGTVTETLLVIDVTTGAERHWVVDAAVTNVTDIGRDCASRAPRGAPPTSLD